MYLYMLTTELCTNTRAYFSIQHPHVTHELLFFSIDTHMKFHVSCCGIASIQYSTRKSRGEKYGRWATRSN